METTFQLALKHHQQGRLEEAEALYRETAEWRPDWALGNLGMVLRITGRLEEAEDTLRRACAADPANLRNVLSLGLTLIQRGQYAEGWRHYQARLVLDPQHSPPAPPPPWQGESLKGKRLLVMPEQGLGDVMLFSRFIPLLAESAGEVIVAAPRALVRLLSDLPARVLYPDDWTLLEADAWTHIGSAPRWLGAGPADAEPAISAPTLDTTPKGVGLMLTGAAVNPTPQRLPPPQIQAAIRGLADFVELDPQLSGARDFADTAQIIAGLDSVVTVDTSVAHLAGAMGKPVTILLPRPSGDWYTNWHDDRSPWYRSARLVRQRRPGDWAGVLADLARKLEDGAGNVDA